MGDDRLHVDVPAIDAILVDILHAAVTARRGLTEHVDQIQPAR